MEGAQALGLALAWHDMASLCTAYLRRPAGDPAGKARWRFLMDIHRRISEAGGRPVLQSMLQSRFFGDAYDPKDDPYEIGVWGYIACLAGLPDEGVDLLLSFVSQYGHLDEGAGKVVCRAYRDAHDADVILRMIDCFEFHDI